MNEIIKLFNSFGVHLQVSEENVPIFMFCSGVLILALIALFCVLNIMFYLAVLYISDNERLLKVVSANPLMLKIFNFYKQTRVVYIIVEFLTMLACLGCIIWYCSVLVYGLS